MKRKSVSESQSASTERAVRRSDLLRSCHRLSRALLLILLMDRLKGGDAQTCFGILGLVWPVFVGAQCDPPSSACRCGSPGRALRVAKKRVSSEPAAGGEP